MKKRILRVLVALLLVALPSWAIFGIGEIVHDPISYANAVLMLGELVKSYEQLKAEYDLLVQNLKTVPVDMLSRYRTLGTNWYGLQLPSDRFSNLSDWLTVVNSGGGALGAYNKASVTLGQYGSQVSQLPQEDQQRVASSYASLELTDGTNVQSMEVAGMLRANSAANDQTIRSLEADSLSLDPAMNTEIAVLNKINAAVIAELRSARDTNRVLLSNLEQQVAASKKQRDAEATEINGAIKRLQQGADVKAAYTSSISQSLQGFVWK